MGSKCVWASSISFEKDELMDWAEGRQERKPNKQQ
jgi:hypothetical protein